MKKREKVKVYGGIRTVEWSRLAARHTGPHCPLANLKRKLKNNEDTKIKEKKERRRDIFWLLQGSNMQRDEVSHLSASHSSAMDGKLFWQAAANLKVSRKQNEIGTSFANAKEHCQFDFAI